VVTTNLNPGLTELSRRRMADYLQLSAASRLRYYVKQKNTPEIRNAMLAELMAFSRQLQKAGRVIEEFEIEVDTVNTDAQRAAGEEHILWRVRLIGHILALVLETEIATGTVIERAA
jgi:phage tail sheath protein FI